MRNAILHVALAAFLALFIGEFRFQSTYWNAAYLDSEFVEEHLRTAGPWETS